MPEVEWLQRWEEKHASPEEKEEIANMASEDYLILLEEIEHR